MYRRQLTTRSLALAAVIAVVGTPLMAQQDTARLRRTTSQTRINVSKGEVELRVDTVYVTRYDTVRVQNTVVRVDTVVVAAPAPPVVVKQLGSWYWGLFAGATSPEGEIDDLYTNGFHGGVTTGWDPRNSWIGFRLGAAINQIGREQGRDVLLVGSGTPLMWQFFADLKPKINVGGWTFYGIGGLGWNSYNRIASVADADELDFGDGDVAVCRAATADDDGACFRPASGNWRSDFSWNFGLGTDFHIGSQDMYLEWRWNPIATNGAYTWYMPISLGLRYF